jgi:hypothetical protein
VPDVSLHHSRPRARRARLVSAPEARCGSIRSGIERQHCSPVRHQCLRAREFAHRHDYGDRLDAHPRDEHQQIDYLLFVVGETIVVELLADGRVLGSLLFMLVEDPFERRAVAEAVVPGSRGTPESCVSLSSWMKPMSLFAFNTVFGARPAFETSRRACRAAGAADARRSRSRCGGPSAVRPTPPSARNPQNGMRGTSRFRLRANFS